MRECQLCGAKSWGPLEQSGRSLLLATFAHPDQTVVDPAAYQQCDNCGMPALTQIVEKSVDISTISAESTFTAIGLPPLQTSPDYVGMVDKMVAAMNSLPKPEPETRLERIVRALIGKFEPAGWAEYPADVVSTARKIEREMDKAP